MHRYNLQTATPVELVLLIGLPAGRAMEMEIAAPCQDAEA